MSYYYVWVGGLKGVVQEKDLTEIFQPYGKVLHVRVVRDPETKKSKHCALVVYGDERTAEYAATQSDHISLMGSTINTRGPADQRRRGLTGIYTGKIGYVPTKDGDKRPYTDCCHYASGGCTNSPDIVQLASRDTFDQVKQKFKDDWAHAKGEAPSIKAVFVIKNQALEKKWKVYKSTLPGYYQYLEEDHYHGTKLCCNISSQRDLCTSRDCSVCRISEEGFSEFKIRQNIPHFQRFGRGFYLAPKSSKCHDYTQGAHSYRAMLCCRVLPGNKYKLTKDDSSLQGPPIGYHSIFGVAGGSLNYEEIVLPKADAILPKFIIVYRKDGEQKIAK